MEEKIFFNQGDVSVSNARFIVYGQTYAMNGVTSVKQGVENPSRLGPIVVALIGLGFLVGGSFKTVVIAFIAIGLAILFWRSQSPDYSVVLNTASGEKQALVSKDKKFIDGVIEALNQSIIHRG